MTQPTREQNRREAIRRVQMGVGGLAAVVLLVSLTNIVIENVRQEEAADAQQSAPATADVSEMANMAEPAPSSEPLADLGVTPVQEGEVDAGAVPAVVPDLDPDPALQKPMDRDPGARGDGTRQ